MLVIRKHSYLEIKYRKQNTDYGNFSVLNRMKKNLKTSPASVFVETHIAKIHLGQI